jgi:diacylglycerol kinase family enzyme
MGTANVLGLDLNLPRDVDGALEVLARRKTTPIDVALVNGHLSFLVTGVGFDGMAVREVEARRTGPITKLAYATAALRCLRAYRPPRLRVEVDGARQPGEYGFVLISNIVHYGGVMRLDPSRRLDDGLFEVYLFRDARVLRLAATALRGMLRHLGDGPHCKVLRARSVRVASDEPVPYQVDGDYRGVTPIDFSVTGRQAMLLVP